MRRLALALALLAALPAQAAEIHAFGRDGWARITAAHAGRPLLVHFWSLTCAPCIAELPEWGRRAAAPHSYDLVLVSTDSIAEAPRLQAMLRRAGLGEAETWAFADSFAARLRFTVDPDWQGELPMTRLVAPAGDGDSVLGELEPQTIPAWLARWEKR